VFNFLSKFKSLTNVKQFGLNQHDFFLLFTKNKNYKLWVGLNPHGLKSLISKFYIRFLLFVTC